jgi:acyl-CoA synthetase (AMP-forming)/AMP-acid ligase II
VTGRFPTLSACLRHYAQSTPAAIAVAHGAEVLSYAELDACVDRCAALLLAHDIKAGDRVAFLGTPRIAFWTTLLASHRIGSIWLGLNPRHRWPELQRILADAEPSLLFCESSADVTAIDQGRLRESGLEAMRLVRVATDERSREPWLDLPAGKGALTAVRAAESCVNPGQAAVLGYTSGSTGSPKGALLSHASLSWGAEIQTR